MTLLKIIKYYIKYRDEINSHYNYALKNGYAYNDEAGWIERTLYWFDCD